MPTAATQTNSSTPRCVRGQGQGVDQQQIADTGNHQCSRQNDAEVAKPTRQHPRSAYQHRCGHRHGCQREHLDSVQPIDRREQQPGAAGVALWNRPSGKNQAKAALDERHNGRADTGHNRDVAQQICAAVACSLPNVRTTTARATAATPWTSRDWIIACRGGPRRRRSPGCRRNDIEITARWLSPQPNGEIGYPGDRWAGCSLRPRRLMGSLVAVEVIADLRPSFSRGCVAGDPFHGIHVEVLVDAVDLVIFEVEDKAALNLVRPARRRDRKRTEVDFAGECAAADVLHAGIVLSSEEVQQFLVRQARRPNGSWQLGDSAFPG